MRADLGVENLALERHEPVGVMGQEGHVADPVQKHLGLPSLVAPRERVSVCHARLRRPQSPPRPACAAVFVRAADGPAGPRLAGGTGTVVIRAVRVISYTESRAGGLYRDGARCPPRGTFGYLNAAQMSTRT